ncbi:hypothetical protein PtA15_9A288 [Puccinia triticina]|uniref:Dihydroxy-acid/6-phosphogluconate dehydratase C-terminal domain-containing protein n=1 Tax=Puccinia triticina TaxID=208348 RepID=A0ABY7CSC0_9BASI|nr:uncharacterized protein PtA15_9A288 [Puccinia triticina]WAQ88163.1 hypothetical protein PtA15_9A288 [Puccinia triticina]WAR60351.1 hypothetical protein PtB15_9B290 [Puccinia triticina]
MGATGMSYSLPSRDLINNSVALAAGGHWLDDMVDVLGYDNDQGICRVIHPILSPIKPTGHIWILKGNLAPGGAVAKITGKEGLHFQGKACVFETKAIETGFILKGPKTVFVLCGMGPVGGPGMPEMLKPTSTIMGVGLGNDVTCLTNGQFSGG